MMSLKLFNKKIPKGYEFAYKGYIRKTRTLKNGWTALFMVNHVVLLFSDSRDEIVAGAVKKIVEADDGKFMLVKKDKTKAIFNQSGAKLADFSPYANLFMNGWFIAFDDQKPALFDKNGDCVCPKIKKAMVFNDGCYFVSVQTDEDNNKAGYFNADGSRIMFTNDDAFYRLINNWVIADGCLYDNAGECLIESHQGNLFNRRLVDFIRLVIPAKH